MSDSPPGDQGRKHFYRCDHLQGERRGFTVGDHDDLLHVFALGAGGYVGPPAGLAGVGVVRTDFDPRQLRDGQLFAES